MDIFFVGLTSFSTWGLVLITLIMTHFTCLAVTIFLHRCQAHGSVELSPIISHPFRMWLWLTTGMVTKEWAAIHRKHHALVEQDEDPHSPLVYGIWRVVFGGVGLYRKECKNSDTMKTYGRGIVDDWIERNLYAPYHFLGIYIMLGADVLLFGVVPGLIIWLVQMLWIPFWAAGIINGIGHFFGYRNFATKDASTNIIPWGIIIAGEELHNNHHAYASSAQLSNRWFEFDIGWVYIKFFQFLGLAKVNKAAPKVVYDRNKTVCDIETVKAVVQHRLQVMAKFRASLRKAVAQEISKVKADIANYSVSDIAALRRVKQALCQDNFELNNEMRIKLNQILSRFSGLENLFQLKKALTSLWDSSSLTQEHMVERLNEWCSQAELSGYSSLAAFSKRLRTYALA